MDCGSLNVSLTYTRLVVETKRLHHSQHYEHRSRQPPATQQIRQQSTGTPIEPRPRQEEGRHHKEAESDGPEKGSDRPVDGHGSLNLALRVRAPVRTGHVSVVVSLEEGLIAGDHSPQVGPGHEDVGYAEVDYDESTRAQHSVAELLPALLGRAAGSSVRPGTLAGAYSPAEGEDDQEPSDDGETGGDPDTDLERNNDSASHWCVVSHSPCSLPEVKVRNCACV